MRPPHAAAAPHLALLVACGPPPASEGWTTNERALIASLVLEDLTPPPDPTNRVADLPAARALGQRLFDDPGFSANGQIACRTCHDPTKAFTDGKPVAEGLFTGTRNAPGLVGAAWSPWLFWDGRVDSLWAQALGPVENPIEHAWTRLQVVRRLESQYAADWEPLFGPLPELAVDAPQRARPVPNDPTDPLHVAWMTLDESTRHAVDESFANFGKAIAAYERTMGPSPTRFDTYAAAVRDGKPAPDALSDDERAGLQLFIGRANCIACHAGPRFTNDAFHNLQLPDPAGTADRGRALGAPAVLADPFNCLGPWSDAPAGCDELRFLDPAFPDFDGAFRTPSLRGALHTAPYMHNGVFATLDEVLDFYAELPRGSTIGHRELTLQPLHFTASEHDQLKSFLITLSPEAAK